MRYDDAMNVSTWFRDTAERALSTLVQAMIVYFLAAQASDYGNWKAILAAVFPAVGSVILNAVSVTFPPIRSYWVDVISRIVRTALASVLGAAVADTFDLFQVSAWRMAFIGAVGSVLVVIKSELAKRRTNTITPASLAKADPTDDLNG